MARESALWQRMRTGMRSLRLKGVHIDLQRLENAIGTGHPDVEGCIDGQQVWIELKSEMRPRRLSTPIHPKVRDSQRDWHRTRCAADCRCNWVLLQVGEGHVACLYLIPGCYYEKLIATETELAKLSFIQPNDSVDEALLTASRGW